jgi:hypothetical protein
MKKISWREREIKEGVEKREKDRETEKEMGAIQEERSTAGTHLVPVLQLDVAWCEVEVEGQLKCLYLCLIFGTEVEELGWGEERRRGGSGEEWKGEEEWH